MEERRKYSRVKVEIKLIYKVLGEKGEVSVPTIDLGGGGVRISLNTKCKIGTTVELGIMLPDEEEMFFSLGKVVWQSSCITKSSRKQDCYDTGIKFLNMGVAYRERLVRFIHSKLKEEGKRS